MTSSVKRTASGPRAGLTISVDRKSRRLENRLKNFHQFGRQSDGFSTPTCINFQIHQLSAA